MFPHCNTLYIYPAFKLQTPSHNEPAPLVLQQVDAPAAPSTVAAAGPAGGGGPQEAAMRGWAYQAVAALAQRLPEPFELGLPLWTDARVHAGYVLAGCEGRAAPCRVHGCSTAPVCQPHTLLADYLRPGGRGRRLPLFYGAGIRARWQPCSAAGGGGQPGHCVCGNRGEAARCSRQGAFSSAWGLCYGCPVPLRFGFAGRLR